MHAFTGPSQLCLRLRMDQVVQGMGSDPQTHHLLAVMKAQSCDSPQELWGQPRSPLIPAGSCQHPTGLSLPEWLEGAWGAVPGLGAGLGDPRMGSRAGIPPAAAPVLGLLCQPGFPPAVTL